MTGPAVRTQFPPLTTSILEHARRRPDDVAVVAGDASLTYAELDAWSGKVARRLHTEGVGRGDPVAVVAEAGLAIAPSVLGILRSGGAYVPISPLDPPERVRYVIEDTGARVAVTAGEPSSVLRSALAETVVVEAHAARDHTAEGLEAPACDPQRVAYILYTSGSSGRPKGVMVPHRALAYYVRWHLTHLAPHMGARDLPLTSSICFAAGVTQFYAPLVAGRTLHVLDPGLLHDAEALFGWYGEHPEFGLYCVPTLWNDLLRYAASGTGADGTVTPPACVLLSGEEVTQALVNRSYELLPDTRLWNLYGPTETTANATFAELKPHQPVTIGRALHGSEVTLRDEGLAPVRPGEPGEICVSGPGLALGYLNQPDLTADRFVPHPETPGTLLYRTGDLASANGDGSLHFLGRKDFQVQIRGHRVECGEVEAVLGGHPAVRQAVVVPRSGPDGPSRLVAYVVFRFARYAPVDALREHAARSLPEYMVPSAFVLLDELPKLPNGKVDRNRLPPVGRERPPLGYPFEPPRDIREHRVVRIWEEVLGLDGVGVHDNFLDLGGDSLRAAEVLARLSLMYGTRVSYGDFFDHPTPAELARLVSTADRGPNAAVGGGDARQPRDAVRGAPRCTDNQRALWQLARSFDRPSAYHIQFSVYLEGPVDVAGLELSLSAILERHEALRFVFPNEGSEPGAVARPVDQPLLAIHDLSSSPDDAPSREARILAKSRDRPFDLAKGPLYRFALIKRSDTRWRLVVTVHHIVFDGRSIEVFARELMAGYDAVRRGGVAGTGNDSLEHEPWVQDRLAQIEARYAEDARYWRDALKGAPTVLNLPPDYPRPPVLTFTGSSLTRRLPPDFRGALRTLCGKSGATPFMALLAVFNVLLHRFTGQDDILVGTPTANREGSGDLHRIGYLANMTVIRTQLRRDDTFAELLRAVRARCLEAYEHQSFPLERLVEELNPERSPNQTPLVQVSFAYHEGVRDAVTRDGVAIRVREDVNPGAKFDLALDIHSEEDGLHVVLTYRRALFAGTTMERFLDHFIHLATEVTRDPELPLRRHAHLLPAEEDLLASWNRTDRANEQDRGLEAIFAEQARRRPHRVAVLAGESTLTYEELNRETDRLAHHLQALGAGPGTTVGIHLEPSASMIVAVLGILKAGAAYVPLDPYYPRDRIDYVMSDSGVGVVITQRHLAERLGPAGPRLVLLEDLPDDLSAYPDTPPEHTASPDDPMYIMYTSGSSGRPKGVVVPRRGPANYVLWMRDAFPLAPDDRVLCRTSINFDISVWEIFLPLISGCALVVGLPGEIQAPDMLARLIRERSVTQVQFVPSALRAFVDAGELPRCRSLRRIFSGGEALPRGLQDEVFDAFDGELHNLYGPTEASIYSCHWQCDRASPYRSVPIGRPIHNTRIHILDADGERVMPGAVGEIYIGGSGVASGYHGQPDATAGAFVPDPFSADPTARLFKTGDSGRYLPDGAIEFLGRSDRLVKVRGYRIELGEIEHHLTAHPQVNHAIIIVREDDESDVRLVAYLLYDDKKGPSPEELRAHLRQKLPDYMIPSHFEVLDSIPLLPNDKADLSALPEPEFQKKIHAPLSRHYANDTERSLTSIWEEVLGHGRFGPSDSFFDVGGHSLLMARLGSRIEERLGVKVSDIDLFQFPTIRSLAQHLSAGATPVRRATHDMTRRAAMANRRRPTRPSPRKDS